MFVKPVVTASSSTAKAMQSRTHRVRKPIGIGVAQARNRFRSTHISVPPSSHQTLTWMSRYCL